jgi:hypothetical protein
VSAARHLQAVPVPDARVVYLDERRRMGRDDRPPAPMLRLVTSGDEAQLLRLDVFLRRARAVLADPTLTPGFTEIPPRIA